MKINYYNVEHKQTKIKSLIEVSENGTYRQVINKFLFRKALSKDISPFIPLNVSRNVDIYSKTIKSKKFWDSITKDYGYNFYDEKQYEIKLKKQN